MWKTTAEPLLIMSYRPPVTYVPRRPPTRDAKFRLGGPVGSKIYAPPGCFAESELWCRVHAGLGGSDHYVLMLAAGLRATLERWWPGSMWGSPDLVRCRFVLQLRLRRMFYITTAYRLPPSASSHLLPPSIYRPPPAVFFPLSNFPRWHRLPSHIYRPLPAPPVIPQQLVSRLPQIFISASLTARQHTFPLQMARTFYDKQINIRKQNRHGYGRTKSRISVK